MEADFFNNACAFIPLLVLTKVAERARREAQRRGQPSPAVSTDGWHTAFIGFGLIGACLALVASIDEARRGWGMVAAVG